MADGNLDAFVRWFEQNDGILDKEHIGFTTFPVSEGGRGAVALRDIQEGHTLFTIPRSLVISTRTSSLPQLFGLDEWKRRKLDQGWVGLILCMMWEESKGSSSKWGAYLASLPSSFDTPVFWSDSDLEHLRGTTVVEKLGKDDAERDYNETLVPAVQSRPDLFSTPTHYSLHQYHVMGSRILSRSFNVEKWESEDDGNGNENDNELEEADNSRSMEVDEQAQHEIEHVEEEEEEQEDSSDVAMVPMADLLNARYESENAKLFYEENVLKMISTSSIKCGEQIWNTYGDLPNSELLRRYGHVDLLPLPSGKLGNPGDVVEVRADLIVGVVAERMNIPSSTTEERIEWWLEEGGDDVYDLDYDLEIPPAMMSLVKLISLSSEEWQKVKGKGKPPKAKLDQDVAEVLRIVLQRRLQQYPTSLEDDEKSLGSELPLNARHALVVRIAEKRILAGVLGKLDAVGKGTTKRKRENGSGSMPDAKKRK